MKAGIDEITSKSLSWDPLLITTFRFTMAISDNHHLWNIIQSLKDNRTLLISWTCQGLDLPCLLQNLNHLGLSYLTFNQLEEGGGVVFPSSSRESHKGLCLLTLLLRDCFDFILNHHRFLLSYPPLLLLLTFCDS